MSHKKIPTILGLLILFLGIAAGLFLVKEGPRYFSRASPEENPKSILVTNISHNSFTVSWLTDAKVSGSVSYGQGSSLNLTAFDERGTGAFGSHFVMVKNLNPQTKYSFQIVSGKTKFGQTDSPKINQNCQDFMTASAEGPPFEITTGPSLNIPANYPSYGTILMDSSGSLATGAIACLIFPNLSSTPVSGLVKESGNVLLTPSNSRSLDFSSFVSFADLGEKEEIYISGENGATAFLTCETGKDHPWPTIILGETKNCSSETNNLSPQSHFQSLSDSSPSAVLEITNPLPNASVEDTLPTFRGKGPPGKTIEILVESENIFSQQIKVNNDGSWSWTPPENLSPGEHKATISYIDDEGNQQIVQRNFIIAGSSSLLPEVYGTPSGGLVIPTPTPTPFPTPTPTVTPSAIIPPAPNGVPQSGFSLPTVLLLTLGTLLVILSLMPKYLLKIINFITVIIIISSASPVWAVAGLRPAKESSSLTYKDFLTKMPKAPLLLLLAGLTLLVLVFIFSRKKKISPAPAIQSEIPPTETPSQKAPLEETAVKVPYQMAAAIPQEKKVFRKMPRFSLAKMQTIIRGPLMLGFLFVFLGVSLAGGVYLVKQRQEMRSRAESCSKDCSAITDVSQCWSDAGSGCAWQEDPNIPGVMGRCYCSRTAPPPPPPPPAETKCTDTQWCLSKRGSAGGAHTTWSCESASPDAQPDGCLRVCESDYHWRDPGTWTDCVEDTPPPGGGEVCGTGQQDCPSGDVSECVRKCGDPPSGFDWFCNPNKQCKKKPKGEPDGCCNAPNDSSLGSGGCDSWESCDNPNGACSSGFSCRSHSGCFTNSDCGPTEKGYKCVNRQCQGPDLKTVSCGAGANGVGVTNNTQSAVTVNISWFAKTCEGDSCLCAGQPFTENNVIIQPKETWSRGMIGKMCGSWQADIDVTGSGVSCSNANNGCDNSQCATPPPAADSLSCEDCGILAENWQQISDPSTLTPNTKVYFATHGKTTHAQGITRAKIRITKDGVPGTWQETINFKMLGSVKWFYIPLTTIQAASYKIESMVYNPGLGWK